MSYVRKKENKRLTKEEKEGLKKDYPNMTNTDLAKKYGINRQSVENMAQREGWKKSEEFLALQHRKGGMATKAKKEFDSQISKMLNGMKSRRIKTGLLYQKQGMIIHIPFSD